VKKVGDEKVFVLRALQARQPERVHQPFFARYDPEAVWFDELTPADEESAVFFQRQISPNRGLIPHGDKNFT
jgi:hypothetical protein